VASGMCAHSDLEVHQLVGEGRDRVVEAEAVLADLVCGKDVVALALFLAVQDHLLLAWFFAGSVD